MLRRNFCKIGTLGLTGLILPKKFLLGEIFAQTQKEWAIIYATQCGTTKEAAEYINEGMGNIADVIDVSTSNLSITNYKHIILGSGIYGGNIRSTMQSFVNSNKDNLKNKVRALFVLCGNGNKDVDVSPPNYSVLGLFNIEGIQPKTKIFWGRSGTSINCNSLTNQLKKEKCIAFAKEITTTYIANNKIMNNEAGLFELYQNYPNPFKGNTLIKYKINKATNVVLSIYNMTGKKIMTFVSGYHQPGNYEIKWDGSKFRPGYYIYRLETNNFSETKTAIILP